MLDFDPKNPPFQGVNREQPDSGWGSPKPYTPEELEELARQSIQPSAPNTDPLPMHPDDYRKMQAWALENGIDPVTGRPLRPGTGA